MTGHVNPERFETVVIGGGQAGLSVGYYMAQRGRPCVILDAGAKIGDSWRNRWDSLLLFTPARVDGLPGMPFPAPGSSFITKDQMADYVESYAERFQLPVRTGVKTRPTWMAGKEFGHIPFRIETFVARHLLLRIVRFVGHRVLTVKTPIGRKVRPKLLAASAPLVRVKPKDLVAADVERVSRVVGVHNGLPLLEDGRTVEVANVIWCTGFRPGFSWIDLPILGDRQEPAHESGVVTSQPGLYFVGLHFLHSMTSETITGVPRDAKRIVKHIAASESKGQRARGGLAAASMP